MPFPPWGWRRHLTIGLLSDDSWNVPCLEQLSCPLPIRAVKAEHSPLHSLPQLLAHNQVLCQLQPWPGLKVGGYTNDLQYTGISQKGLARGQYTASFLSPAQ